MLTQQRQAEALANRQARSAQPANPVQQQAQSFAQTAGRNLATPAAQQQAVGPLGPQLKTLEMYLFKTYLELLRD